MVKSILSKGFFTLGKHLILVFGILLITSFDDHDCIKSLMLGYDTNTNVSELYYRILKDPRFKILTSKEKFEAKGEFEAKFCERTKTYSNADSLYFSVYNAKGDSIGTGKPEKLITIQITAYYKKYRLVKKELNRLKYNVCKDFQVNRLNTYQNNKVLNENVYVGRSCANENLTIDFEHSSNEVFIYIIDLEKN